MNRIVSFLPCAMAILLFMSCSGMRKGVGMRGIFVDNDDECMTLDGDTFSICERIDDSLLVVSKEPYVDEVPDYLIKKERNGFYYMQAEADDIYSIYGTNAFMAFGNRDIYDIRRKKTFFRTECDVSEGLSYYGTLDDKCLFGNPDSLCFSDGKYIGLQPNVYCRAIGDKDSVRLTFGAQHMDVSLPELYQCVDMELSKDSTVRHLKKDYFVKPRNEYEYDGIGYDVDLEIPSGNNAADVAIRQWMTAQIRNDVFSLLETDPAEMPISKCGSVETMLQCLDLYGNVWEKMMRNDYQEGDTLCSELSSHIIIRKIVDGKDYVTYYFSSEPYMGGLHEVPRSYYATYDKRRNEFLTTSNTVKENARDKFTNAVLWSLKRLYDEGYGEKSEWEKFTKSIFSFSCPFEEGGEVNEMMDELYGSMYYCDKEAEWKDKPTPYNVSDFPLPHLAIIPEGMVLTYHPYQIDCFFAGEYHAVIPLKDIAQYLQYEYKQDTSPLRLNRFIKVKEK